MPFTACRRGVRCPAANALSSHCLCWPLDETWPSLHSLPSSQLTESTFRGNYALPPGKGGPPHLTDVQRAWAVNLGCGVGGGGGVCVAGFQAALTSGGLTFLRLLVQHFQVEIKEVWESLGNEW